MKKNSRVGLTPIPTDANIEYFLNDLYANHRKKLNEVLLDMAGTIERTEAVGEPAIFSYAKLLNYLSSEQVKKPELIRLLAAALWELEGDGT